MTFKSVTVLDDNGLPQVELNTKGLSFNIPDSNGVNASAMLRLEAGSIANTLKLVVYRDGFSFPITLIDNIGA